VEGYCTCGAKLVEDAQFCHRCGRPLREDLQTTPPDAPAPIAEPLAPAMLVEGQAPPMEPAAINLRNGLAVRVGMKTAALAFLVVMLVSMTGLALLRPVIVLLAGGYSAAMYRQRSGQTLSVLGGAQVGWIAGLFSFVISLVVITAGMVVITASGNFAQVIQEASQKLGSTGAEVEKISAMLKNPLAMLLLLAFEFVLLTVLSSMGGALAARFLFRERS
jgi:hypothetical protein